MIDCEAGNIILVRFPFTDLTTVKRRPAVVLSPVGYSENFADIVLMPLTSQPQQLDSLALTQWAQAGLPKPTWVKPLVGTLSAGLVDRSLGTLQSADDGCVRRALAMLLAKRWT